MPSPPDCASVSRGVATSAANARRCTVLSGLADRRRCCRPGAAARCAARRRGRAARPRDSPGSSPGIRRAAQLDGAGAQRGGLPPGLLQRPAQAGLAVFELAQADQRAADTGADLDRGAQHAIVRWWEPSSSHSWFAACFAASPSSPSSSRTSFGCSTGCSSTPAWSSRAGGARDGAEKLPRRPRRGRGRELGEPLQPLRQLRHVELLHFAERPPGADSQREHRPPRVRRRTRGGRIASDEIVWPSQATG